MLVSLCLLVLWITVSLWLLWFSHLSLASSFSPHFLKGYNNNSGLWQWLYATWLRVCGGPALCCVLWNHHLWSSQQHCRGKASSVSLCRSDSHPRRLRQPPTETETSNFLRVTELALRKLDLNPGLRLQNPHSFHYHMLLTNSSWVGNHPKSPPWNFWLNGCMNLGNRLEGNVIKL